MIGPRPEVLEEICCSLPCHTIRTIRFMPVRGVGEAAPTTNLLVRYTFLMKNRIRPRRGRVTPPYREFTGLQRDLKRFVGNGLDRSGCSPYFGFWVHCLWAFGKVRTVPYRAFYCRQPTIKRVVGRGALTPPRRSVNICCKPINCLQGTMLASSRMTGLAQYSTPEYSKYHQKKQDTPHPRIKSKQKRRTSCSCNLFPAGTPSGS